MDDVKALTEVLLEAQKMYPSAVIAGGALRDLNLGKPIKDIDIFVLDSERAGTACLMPPKFAIMTHTTLPDYLSSHVKSITTCRYEFVPYPVQFIFIDKPIEKFIEKTFDFGICMIWFDGKDIHTFKEYVFDSKYKMISLRSNVESNALTLEHYRRIKKKYPDYIGMIS